jgi:hypothetical protein
LGLRLELGAASQKCEHAVGFEGEQVIQLGVLRVFEGATGEADGLQRQWARFHDAHFRIQRRIRYLRREERRAKSGGKYSEDGLIQAKLSIIQSNLGLKPEYSVSDFIDFRLREFLALG